MTKSTKITIIAIVLIIILAIGFVIPTGNLFAATADNKNIKITFSGEYNDYTDSLYYYDRETGREDKTKNLLDYPDYFAEKFIELNVRGDEWIEGLFLRNCSQRLAANFVLALRTVLSWSMTGSLFMSLF